MLKLLLVKIYRQRGRLSYFISLCVLLSLAFMTILGLYFSEISSGYRSIKAVEGYDLWVMSEESKSRENFVCFNKKKLILNAETSALIKQIGFIDENEKHEVAFGLIALQEGVSKSDLIKKIEVVSGLKVVEPSDLIQRSFFYQMSKDSSSVALTLSVSLSLMLVLFLTGALFYQLIYSQRKLCHSFRLEGFKPSSILRSQLLFVSLFSLLTLFISSTIFITALYYLRMELSIVGDYLLLLSGVGLIQQGVLVVATALYFLAPRREREYADC